MKDCYIVLNTILGWKVVLDGKHIDCSNPLYINKDLKDVVNYCNDSNLRILRVCK